MWHELVLHGIGGRTIREAKENLSQHEFQRWAIYIKRYGSLDWGFRLEESAALITWMTALANGNKTAKIEHFMPHFPEKLKEPEFATAEDILKMVKTSAARPPRKGKKDGKHSIPGEPNAGRDSPDRGLSNVDESSRPVRRKRGQAGTVGV